MTHRIAFTIPPPNANLYLFRRALLHAIRLAVSEAQARGEIDAETAVALLRALPDVQP